MEEGGKQKGKKMTTVEYPRRDINNCLPNRSAVGFSEGIGFYANNKVVIVKNSIPGRPKVAGRMDVLCSPVWWNPSTRGYGTVGVELLEILVQQGETFPNYNGRISVGIDTYTMKKLKLAGYPAKFEMGMITINNNEVVPYYDRVVFRDDDLERVVVFLD